MYAVHFRCVVVNHPYQATFSLMMNLDLLVELPAHTCFQNVALSFIDGIDVPADSQRVFVMQALFALLWGSTDEQKLVPELKDNIRDNLLIAEILFGLASLDELSAGKDSCANWLRFEHKPGLA